MPTYDDKLNAISRISKRLVTIKLDFCALTFGVAPCTATGTKCYNTRSTCKDPENYDKVIKDYKFIRRTDQIIQGSGARPYLRKTKELPTEINPEKGIPINARVTYSFDDDDDASDVGIDPYVSERASVQGSFFKKLLARNPYYEGREVIEEKGFHGIDTAEFQTAFKGIIDAVNGPANGKIDIIVKDPLKKAENVWVPKETFGKVTDNPLSAGATTVNVDDAAEYETASGADPNWVIIDDEIIRYEGKTATSLTSCTRGQGDTTAASHDIDSVIQQVRVYQDVNPWDIIDDLLEGDMSIPAADIDIIGAELERDTWIPGYQFTAWLTKPKKVIEHLADLCVQSGSYIWWAYEDQKFNWKVISPGLPSETIPTFDDTKNIIKAEPADRNEDARVSVVAVYYNLKLLGDPEEPDDYLGRYIAVDSDKEGDDQYGSRKVKSFLCRWITATAEAQALGDRYLARYKIPPPEYTFTLEMKDSSLKTGGLCSITSDDFVDVDGNPLTKLWQVLKKEPKGKNEIAFTALDMRWDKRIGLFAPAGLPTYGDADAGQKLYGFFSDGDGLINEEDGYYFY